MGSKAHYLRVAKPLSLLVAGAFTLLITPSSFPGEKIELDRSSQVHVPKGGKSVDDLSPSFRTEVSKPEVGGPSIMTPPAPPSSRALEKSLQEMIDRKQNWLFYGPNDADPSKDFLKRKDSQGDFDNEAVFRSKSERYMAGEEDPNSEKSSNKRPESSSRDNLEQQDSTNSRDRFSRRNDRNSDDDPQINQEFNISGYLQPNRLQENRALKPASFLEKNQYTFRPTIANDPTRNQDQNAATRDADKRRASDFQTLIGGPGVGVDLQKIDPLAGLGADPTRREVNPSAPARFGAATEGLGASAGSSFSRETPGSGFAIPRPNVLDGFSGQGAKSPLFGENTASPIPQPGPAVKAAPFMLEIPKRKF